MAPKQLMFATTWGLIEKYGVEKLPAIVKKLRSLGYAGIEMPVAYACQFGVDKFAAMMREEGALWVAMTFTCGAAPTPGNFGCVSTLPGVHHPADKEAAGTRDVGHHKRVLEAQVAEVAALAKGPGAFALQVTSHTGKDYFTAEQADELYAFAVSLEHKYGLRINHETHRSRIAYSPWVMERILAAHPELRFTADYSHFTVVAEAGPADPELNAVLAQLAPRVRHVHARVGFEEGPQIPDPRSPLWKTYWDGHVAWWRAIYEARIAEAKAAGATDALVITTTPEFGPSLYAWTDAYTGKPINNIWAVNHWVGQQMAALWAATAAAAGLEGAQAAQLAEDPEEGAWAL